MNPVVVARLRIGLLLVVAVVIQTALATDLRVGRVTPDFMILVVICAGLTGGTEAGAWVGFCAGLLYDMFLVNTPIGLSALAYCLVGAAVGSLRATVLQERRALLPLTAFIGTAVGVLLFVGCGDVLGQTQLLAAGRSWLIRVMIVEALWNAVLALPVGYLYVWLARGSVGADKVGTSITARPKTTTL
ncbi:MAG TPA: rod shape-determining protein MreD [Acidimicrobiales bacterium]|jgi:rod shape-determining protein MreD|nr:rod shape-determining protein MreD [Acidimicrobiales bacterium]